MKQIYFKLLFLFGIALLFYACEDEEQTPEQEEREKIMAIEDLLRDNHWAFNDMFVSVKYETQAVPLMANVADENGMVQPGKYDSYAIFGNNNRQLRYTYEFTRDDILLDTTNLGNFTKTGGYYVLSTSQIRINPDSSRKVNFDYLNDSQENIFILSTASPYSEDFIASINNRIVESIISDKPNDLANAVVDLIVGNEKVSDAINKFLYDLIHGKIEEITQSPEEISESLARLIVEKLAEIEWEEFLYNKIFELLKNLQAENPEEKASEMAQRITDKINASLAPNDLYNVLLPILQNFERETLPVLSSQIAEAVYSKIATELSEENIYNKVYPVWEQLITADSTTVVETADTLAAIATAHFFDVDTLTQKVMPFVQEIEDTPSRNLSALAQEIIDDALKPTIEQINETFPGLELEPDWKSVKPIISSILTGIKAKLATSTVEELSANLADGLIDIMDLVLQKGFEKAIYSLKSIPADQAASVVAAWITNLIEMAEQPVVDFIEGKLDEIFQNFEAEKAARQLSTLIYAKINELFSEESLYDLFLPMLESLQEANVEQIAQTISKMIIEAGLLKDNITEEELVEALTKIIANLIGKINPDEATQKLVDAILESELVENIDGNVLKLVLEIKIYELYGKIAQNVNSIDGIEIVLQIK